MATDVYAWKRFLYKRGEKYLLGDDGFLLDPDAEYASLYGQNLLTIHQVQDTQCLVLLGEPGIGKSHVLNQLHGLFCQASAANPNTSSDYKDLRSYGSEQRVVDDLFRTPEFLEWRNGNGTRYVFLDSLDEALIRVETLASILVDELGALPQNALDRLYLRIACRTGTWGLWSEFLEEGLRRLWPDQEIEAPAEDSESQLLDQLDLHRTSSTTRIKVEHATVYEIAPLRRTDVELAATVNKLESMSFLADLESRRVTAFARVPITLELLLSLAGSGEPLPVSRWDLYNQGCLALCQENNPQRRSPQLRGDLSGEQRIEIAGLLAMLTVFCNRSTIAADPPPVSDNLETLNASDILKHVVSGGSPPVSITKRSLEEVLQSTGLFTAMGADLYCWCHQTYAEFLAAWYISKQPIAEHQVLSVLLAADNHIVPQLAETAVWLSCKFQETLKHLIENDPDVALHSDPASATGLASALVDSLLSKLRDGKIDTIPISHRSRYPMVEHDKLADQLAGYIRDYEEDWLVRRTAMDIGDVCGEVGIAVALRDLVMNPTESAALRAHAVLALNHLGNPEHLKEISILLDSPISGDEHSELLGSLLHTLWPDVISIEKVVPLLTIPEADNFNGMYRLFLRHGLVDKMSSGDVQHLLRWLVSAPVGRRALHNYGDLSRKTVTMAFRQLDDPSITKLLAAALRHLERYLDQIVAPDEEEGIVEILAANVKQRRDLLREYLTCAASEGDIIFYFPRMGSPKIYLPSDQAWLLEQLPHVPETERDTWNHFVHGVYDFGQRNALDALFECFNHVPSLKNRFHHAFQPLDLNSDTAKRLREECHYFKSGIGKRGARKQIDSSPLERVECRLKQFEGGDLGAWWELIGELTLEEHSTHYGCAMNSDIRELPGWKSASMEIRGRIVSAAKVYVVDHQVDNERNFGSTTFYRDDMGGYQALALLLHEEPDFLGSLSSEVWKNWCPAIIGFPITTTSTEIDIAKIIFRMAYAKTPSAFLASLDKVLREVLEAGRHISVIHSLADVIDAPMSCIFLKYARDGALKPQCRGELLRVGLSIQHPQSVDYAVKLICQGRGEVRYDDMRIEAAGGVMLHVDGACWGNVWSIFKYDYPCALRLLYRYADLLRYAGKRYHLPDITAEQLCELYIWLAGWFPHQLDPDRSCIHWLTARDQVLDLRRGILSHLKSLGTPQSIFLLRRIQKCFPDLDWMKWTISDAERVIRQRAWRPLEPEQLLALLRDSNRRVVVSEEQLLDLIAEALKRYQDKLRGEISVWYRLWDRQHDGKTYRPKEEERFSDDVAAFLKEDLQTSQAVVNREVQIHSRSQHSSDKTDILVEAFRRASDGELEDRIAVIIEVKGCWNPDLLSSMVKQLVGQYLQNNTCSHGLYLTGWYVCQPWDEEDSKKKAAERHGSIHDLRATLDAQADKLSQSENTIRSIVIDCSIPKKN